MTQAELFFGPWEQAVDGWASAIERITEILTLTTRARNLAWRGVANAGYALHSSLYRRLEDVAAGAPDEKSLVAFEKKLLRRSRSDWRYDNLSALETLAHLQHYGGPTRLLDVTFNPLIALWFAVEQKFDGKGNPRPDTDGRMFAFDVTEREVTLDAVWGARDLPWENPPAGWRNKLPLVWRPPSYNDRIPAQNSAFLIGGVPSVSAGDNAKYRKGPGDGSTMGNWNVDEVRKSTSVTVQMNSLGRRPQARSTPTYTLRVAAACKPDLRQFLEKSFGYNSATIYPDLYGLATHGANGIAID